MKTIYVVTIQNEDGSSWNVRGFVSQQTAERHVTSLKEKQQTWTAANRAWQDTLVAAVPFTAQMPEERAQEAERRRNWIAQHPAPQIPEYTLDTYEIEELQVEEGP